MEKKILILEDEQQVAQLYAKFLRTKGYDPTLAFDGLEGLERVKEVKPDLILLDLNMPKMSGMEFYQHICDREGKPKHPVLVVTGRADLEALFKDFHVDGFIIKPFEGTRLLKEIEIVLNRQYWKKTDGSARRVVIVDDKQESSAEIASVFAKAGYKIDIATSGVSGIENMMAAPPDLAMVNLNLDDISGDLVILRLQQIAKTRNVNSVLYISRDHERDRIVMERFASKRGVKLMCQYNDPVELLDAAIKVFQESEQVP